MNGSHPIERCEEVTGAVLHAVFNALGGTGRRSGGHAAEAQHGHRRGGVPRSGLGGGGRDRDVAVLAAACSRRGAGDRLSVGRPGRTTGDPALGCDQPAAPVEALDDQLLIRAGAAGSGAGGVARTRRESGRRPGGDLPACAAATAPPVSEPTQSRWKMARWKPVVRIAASGATIELDHRSDPPGQFSVSRRGAAFGLRRRSWRTCCRTRNGR